MPNAPASRTPSTAFVFAIVGAVVAGMALAPAARAQQEGDSASEQLDRAETDSNIGAQEPSPEAAADWASENFDKRSAEEPPPADDLQPAPFSATPNEQ